jgi:CDP-diacylglycerol--glycerol-3-phosphate 3-phosphatidyltransferase
VINRTRRSFAQRANRVPASLLARTGIDPNYLTVAGLLLACVVGWVLAAGYLFLGGFLVLLSGAFDLLDGAVARASGRTTKFGALLDSTFDRLSEGAIFVGLLAYYADSGSYLEIILVGAAIVGSMATSYVRARAEGLGIDCEVGIFTRPERVVVLAIGLIFYPVYNPILVISLWVLAILANAIAFQRLLYVWQRTR